MIPTYPYSLSSSSSSAPSPMPIDLNVEDENHELIFSPTHQPSSSSSSLSYPILFNPSQDHAGSSYWEPKHLPSDEEAGKIITSSGSWDDPEEKGIERKRGCKLKVWKRGSEREDQNHQGEDTDSVKWMPSKMRMMKKMMASDQKVSDINIPLADTPRQKKFEDQNQKQEPLLLSPHSSSSNSSSTHSNHNDNNSNITVRVCADCHTTKTPLWRSGPRGPKSLCNACGIRQRKARRAMAAAAAAAADGSALAVQKSPVKGNYKFHSREKSKMQCDDQTQLKKKRKLDDQIQANPTTSRGRIKQFGFEDFTVSSLSKNLQAASQVFPLDEKEAAILLMALSHNGLVHG